MVLARRGKRRDPPLKRFTSWLFYKIFSYLAEIDYDGESGNFRIMSRKVVTSFCCAREQLRFFGGLVQWMGFPTSSIEVEHAERFEGQSTYTFAKLWKLAMETIIAHSDKPLRLAVRFGFMMAIVSFLYGASILIKAFVLRLTNSRLEQSDCFTLFHWWHHYLYSWHSWHLSWKDL